MAWVNIFDVAGVTLEARIQQFATTPVWPPIGSAAVGGGVDYSVASGVIEVISPALDGGLGGHISFSFTDTGGTLAGVPEYPAIAWRFFWDISAVATYMSYTPPPGLDIKYRSATTGGGFQNTPSGTYTGMIYDGGDLGIDIGSDGSFSSQSPHGAFLTLELDVTLALPPSGAFWTDRRRCVEGA